ncbi:MAG: aminoacyl-tRNA hydrolase [Bacteroidota bacterium]|nr:aminoacyl-tRNA hydrolase [Bacteroidota bacterium]
MKILIAGLGNPGKQYDLTRHNIGFIILDLFAVFFQIKLREGNGDWIEGKGLIEDKEVYLLKPLSYMNNSGIAVKEFSERHGIDVKDMLVIVDDFQIPLGTIRIRKKGSDGGHNGLASIIYHLASEEFPRMRIGIGRNDLLRKDEYINFVLSNFETEELEIIKKVRPDYIECLKTFVTKGITKTMNCCNKSFLNEDTNG